MKVLFPYQMASFTSKDILPASCLAKPQVACTSASKVKVNEGLSNQEIYEGIISLKESITSLFGGKKKQTHPVSYVV